MNTLVVIVHSHLTNCRWLKPQFRLWVRLLRTREHTVTPVVPEQCGRSKSQLCRGDHRHRLRLHRMVLVALVVVPHQIGWGEPQEGGLCCRRRWGHDGMLPRPAVVIIGMDKANCWRWDESEASLRSRGGLGYHRLAWMSILTIIADKTRRGEPQFRNGGWWWGHGHACLGMASMVIRVGQHPYGRGWDQAQMLRGWCNWFRCHWPEGVRILSIISYQCGWGKTEHCRGCSGRRDAGFAGIASLVIIRVRTQPIKWVP